LVFNRDPLALIVGVLLEHRSCERNQSGAYASARPRTVRLFEVFTTSAPKDRAE
jgi:hypothetical protein